MDNASGDEPTLVQQPRPKDPHEYAVFGLIYVFFLYLPLLFAPQWPLQSLLLTLAATAVFVPLYLAFFRPGRRTRLAVLGVTVVLGLALMPVNPNANTFIIYAIAMGASTFGTRAAVVFAVTLLAATALQMWLWYSDPRMILAAVAMTAVIGTVVLAGNIYGRLREAHDAALRLSHSEVRRLAALAERERIGRDLHDLLGHTLSLIALKSELANRLLQRDPAAAASEIRDVEAISRDTLGQVRRAVSGIRAAGLAAELAAARLALGSAEVDLETEVDPPALSAPAETALALALREATTNVLRHADARRVWVTLRHDGDRIWMTIEDDGRGMRGVEGNGLLGMRERLSHLDGELRIEKGPRAGGTRLCICLPAALVTLAHAPTGMGANKQSVHT